MDPSQAGQAEDDLAGERGTGSEGTQADLAVGMADRLDAEEQLLRRNVDDQVAQGLRSLELELSAAPRPGDRGAPVPAVEAVVERDVVDAAPLAEVPLLGHV